MAIWATVRQALWDVEDIKTRLPIGKKPSNRVVDGKPVVEEANFFDSQFAIMTCQGHQDIVRALLSTDDKYTICSASPNIVWDKHLVDRIQAAVKNFESRNIPWLCLTSDGLTVSGQQLTGAFFEREPSLTPSRGMATVIQTAGTLYVFNMSTIRALGFTRLPNMDFVDLVNQLIVMAYESGFGTFYSSQLFPCVAGARDISYESLEKQAAAINTAAFYSRKDLGSSFQNNPMKLSSILAWVDEVARKADPKHTFSFVIRTIFKRPHLLRRCLISIDYLRRSSGLQAEIVIASDVDKAISTYAIGDLAREFPEISFVLADGTSEQGYSRVRNLIAGIKATTGSRVCIIDDDDYYTPAAIEPMAAACKFGSESLVIFDTQIINEKWSTNGVKLHKEIVSYGGAFEAKGWMYTLRGSNSIPLCGVIHPGWFARQVAGEYCFDYDYSEDFIFHLICFSHPQRPPVELVDGIGAYQSHRAADDNVSTVVDRTPWVLDIGNGLYNLLLKQGRTFDVISGSEAFSGAISSLDRVRALTAELERVTLARDQATRLLAGTVAKLRATSLILAEANRLSNENVLSVEGCPLPEQATSRQENVKTA